MCELCLEHVDVGPITSNLRLLWSKDARGWGYGWGPGRYAVAPLDGTPLLTFTVQPQTDPWDGWSDERVDASSKEEVDRWVQWDHLVEEFRRQVLQYCGGLQGLMGLPAMLREAGWDQEQDGHVDGWLFHRCGVALERWRQRRERLHGADQEAGKPNGFAPLAG